MQKTMLARPKRERRKCADANEVAALVGGTGGCDNNAAGYGVRRHCHLNGYAASDPDRQVSTEL